MSPALALRVAEANARGYRRVWKGSAVTSFVTPVLFLASMGVGLGTLVGDGTLGLGGIGYLAYIAPGLLAAACLQTGSNESSWPVIAGIKWVKTYHAALATPVGVPELLGGTLMWLGMRLLMTAVMFVIVMWAFGATALAGGIAAIAPAILVGFAGGVPTFAFATRVKSEVRLVALYRFVIMPMFLFSGTFFPVEQLPDLIEPIAVLTPLWHGVELCRAAATHIGTALPVWAHVTYLLLWALPGWWIARRGLERKLQP